MNEIELVNACVEGVATAQKEFYDRFAGKMMGVCLRYADCDEDAEDILQDGFIRVFDKLSSFKFEGSLEGWIRKIMVNSALYKIRSDGEFNRVDLSEGMQVSADASFNTEETMNAKDLIRLIQQLPAGYRVIFNMHVIEGYSHKEIAELTGIAEGTSKSQFSRAKTFLQKALIPKGILTVK